MAVAMMPRDKESWNDDRLVDLNHKVDEGFKDMREEFRAMRAEMREELGALRGDMKDEFGAVRSEIKGEFGEFRTEMREIRSEVAATNRVVAQLAWTMCGTMLIGFLGVIATMVAMS